MQVDHSEQFNFVMVCVVEMAQQYCETPGVKETDPWCSTHEVKKNVLCVHFWMAFRSSLSIEAPIIILVMEIMVW